MMLPDMDDKIVCRYEETGAKCRLQVWGRSTIDAQHTFSGNVELLPDWAQRIRSLALVGGHMPANPHPPPMHILWFEIDPDHNLIGFTKNATPL